MGRLQRVFFLLLAACIQVNAQSKQSFPKMDKIFLEFYQTEVVLSDEDRDFSAVATEYYDSTQNISVLDLLLIGNRITYYYHNFTGDILEVNGTSCVVSPVDESLEYYEPPFYGWVNRNPFVIGPSALLWFAQDKKVDYMGVRQVRGLQCDYFNLNIDGKDDKIEIKYYFAVETWTTAYQFKGLRVPIRIEINGESGRTTLGHLMEDENQIIDFTYFKTTIDDWTKLQPPIGLGCFGEKSELTFPKLPPAFKYSVQIHDMLKTNESDAITYERVYFDNRTLMARIDTWSPKKWSSVVYDFVDGVSYNVEAKSRCIIKPIRKSMFVRDDGHLLSLVKSPQQILGLTGDFYFMGYRMYRGIPCSVFETAKRNVYYQEKFVNLLVVTVFFTQDYTEVVNDGEDLMNAPVYLRITGYSYNKVTLQLQFNIFGFDDISAETLYRSFPIESCFPSTDQRNYFVLVAKSGNDTDKFMKEIARPLEENNSNFLSMIRAELTKTLNISDIRIPFLKADYLSTGIYVTGLMLDRPPALSQFWLMYKARVKLGKNLMLRETVNTKEECAMMCVGESEFLCRGFHFCGQTCLTASQPIDQDPIRNDERHECEVYMRGLANSTNQQPYLADAVSLLEESMEKSGLLITLPVSEEKFIELPFSDVIFGEGPFTKNKPDNSYKLVVENSQLYPEEERETTLDKADVDTLLDCYQACKDSKDISCASFSVCPRAKNKQCRISSVLIAGADVSADDIDDADGCNVYSLLFLELFNKHDQLVPIIPGGKAYRKVSSPEECARRCKLYSGDFTCRGFEYCGNKKTCVLHHRHGLDLTKEEFGIGNKTCVHYSAKYMADYVDMGKTIINEVSKQEQGMTVEECARACSEQLPSCKSFNFCPASQEGASDSVCALSTKTLSSNGATSKDGGKCHMFTKRKDVEDEGWDNFHLDVNKDKPSNNVAGVAVGTIIFGLVVGIAAAIGYSYFRSKRGDDGMAIRFMKS